MKKGLLMVAVLGVTLLLTGCGSKASKLVCTMKQSLMGMEMNSTATTYFDSKGKATKVDMEMVVDAKTESAAKTAMTAAAPAAKDEVTAWAVTSFFQSFLLSCFPFPAAYYQRCDSCDRKTHETCPERRMTFVTCLGRQPCWDRYIPDLAAAGAGIFDLSRFTARCLLYNHSAVPRMDMRRRSKDDCQQGIPRQGRCGIHTARYRLRDVLAVIEDAAYLASAVRCDRIGENRIRIRLERGVTRVRETACRDRSVIPDAQRHRTWNGGGKGHAPFGRIYRER